jgi:hypothetical protein
MRIEQGPKPDHPALNAEDTEQWKEAIGKEMALMESHEVFTLVEKVPEGANRNENDWVMGRKQLANRTIDNWNVRLVGRSDLFKPSHYDDNTSPVNDSASIRLALGTGAMHDLEITVLNIPSAFLGSPVQKTPYMRPQTANSLVYIARPDPL